jgi:hypothetical protein
MTMMDARFLARRIVTAIQSSRINVSTEISAQNAIALALRNLGMEVTLEVPLGAGNRIDLMVGTVGVEVKIGGGRREIFDQLCRYAGRVEVEALVLATGAAWPSAMTEAGGKPFFLASLSQGWL